HPQGPPADADRQPRPGLAAGGGRPGEGRLPLLRPQARPRPPFLHRERARVLPEGRGVRLPLLTYEPDSAPPNQVRDRWSSNHRPSAYGSVDARRRQGVRLDSGGWARTTDLRVMSPTL